jgi:hypothetical protein
MTPIHQQGKLERFGWDEGATRHVVYRSARSSNLIISFFFWP